MEAESRMVLGAGAGGGDGSKHSVGTEIPFSKMKALWRCRGWLYNSAKVPNATELPLRWSCVDELTKMSRPEAVGTWPYIPPAAMVPCSLIQALWPLYGA